MFIHFLISVNLHDNCCSIVDQDCSPMLHSLPQFSSSPVLRCSRFSQSTNLSSHREQSLLSSDHGSSSGKTVTFGGSASQTCSAYRKSSRPDPMDLLQQQLQQRFDLQRQKSAAGSKVVLGSVSGSKGSSASTTKDETRTSVCSVGPNGALGAGLGRSINTGLLGDMSTGGGAGDNNQRPTSDIGLSSTNHVHFERPSSNTDRYSAPPSSSSSVKPGQQRSGSR